MRSSTQHFNRMPTATMSAACHTVLSFLKVRIEEAMSPPVSFTIGQLMWRLNDSLVAWLIEKRNGHSRPGGICIDHPVRRRLVQAIGPHLQHIRTAAVEEAKYLGQQPLPSKTCLNAQMLAEMLFANDA